MIYWLDQASYNKIAIIYNSFHEVKTVHYRRPYI